MKYIVTGGVGFIGYHVTEKLLQNHEEVLVVDKLDSLLYSRETKLKRLSRLKSHFNLRFLELDLSAESIDEFSKDGDVLIHLAALPGQALSWENFESYVSANIVATQRLVRTATKVHFANFIYGSTSSVYGKLVNSFTKKEFTPHSPYGITKLGGENILKCYAANYNFPFNILRFFSVFGPGQRPDMAIQIFLNAIYKNNSITLNGDGSQTRDFTYVDDCVKYIIKAANLNIGELTTDISGDNLTSISDVLRVCFEVTGKDVEVKFAPRLVGDQESTQASPIDSRIYDPSHQPTDLVSGIARQWDALLESEKE